MFLGPAGGLPEPSESAAEGGLRQVALIGRDDSIAVTITEVYKIGKKKIPDV
jgi:hypothetical protein